MLDNTEKFSRREFLRAIGTVTGGAALGSLALLAACQGEQWKSSSGITTPTDNINGVTTPTVPATTTIATTAATSPTAPIGEVYVPPEEYPPLMSERYGCDAGVAADRWYNASHFWIKEIGDNRVVIGLTDKMQRLVGDISRFYFLAEVGDLIKRGEVFAGAEAYKVCTDVVAPVSGKITQLNDELTVRPGVINPYPYSYGWVAVIQLTSPRELEDLIGPGYYAYLQAVDIPPTTPSMRS